MAKGIECLCNSAGRTFDKISQQDRRLDAVEGTPLRSLVLTIAVVLAARPAAAEVCDKVRPLWNPASGRVGQLDDLLLSFAEPPLLLTVLILVGAALQVRKFRLSALCAMVLALIAAIDIATWFWLDDDIIPIAFAEGCVAPPFLTSATLLAIAAALLAIQVRGQRDRAT